MKTILPLVLGVCLLALTSRVLAQGAPGRATGHILLLENERISEGDIERDGNRYRIRRNGGEIWVPANRVIALCDDLQEAFLVLRGRTNLRDADERLRLARWCHLHGLQAEGRAEVEAALVLRPTCAEARRLLHCFELPAPAPVASTGAPLAPPRTLEVVLQPGEGDLAMETFSTFTARIQPILMNACVHCHSAERGGSFQLLRTFEEGSMNRRATQHNLAAVLNQINRDNWQGSPLLLKAGNIHGGMEQPPLKGRQVTALHNLEDWVQKVAPSIPATRPSASGVVPASLTVPADRPATATEPARSDWAVDHAVPAPAASQTLAQKKDTPETPQDDNSSKPRELSHTVLPPEPAPPREPADPFDPILFNGPPQPGSAPPSAPAHPETPGNPPTPQQ
jgi:hypothetical protein